MDWKLLEKIKKITIQALVSDDELMDRLILKGGNALDLIHRIAIRGSIDLDFSMEGSFEDSSLGLLEDRVRKLLHSSFKEHGYTAYDVQLSKRPSIVDKQLDEFWGGYKIEFKLIEISKYDSLKGDIDSVRRNSIPLGRNNSTIFRIEISRYEYCPKPEEAHLDGYTVNVYSPTLIAIEKLRAICQQMNEYTEIIASNKTTPRARDFFDIYTIVSTCKVDLLSPENRVLLAAVFKAKKVPMELLKNVENYREFHRQDFDSLKDIIKPGVELKNFDFYFDFIKSLTDRL